jgi:hypothetical protein
MTTSRKTSLGTLKNFILVKTQGYFSMVATHGMGEGDTKIVIKFVVRGKRRGAK